MEEYWGRCPECGSALVCRGERLYCTQCSFYSSIIWVNCDLCGELVSFYSLHGVFIKDEELSKKAGVNIASKVIFICENCFRKKFSEGKIKQMKDACCGAVVEVLSERDIGRC